MRPFVPWEKAVTEIKRNAARTSGMRALLDPGERLPEVAAAIENLL
jgi:hypothetical protein